MISSNEKPVVLICDDEKGVRESLKVILSDHYEVLFAENGPDALTLLENNNAEVVLLDIKMPKLHGLEVLKKIKQLNPSLPVIVVTGYQSVELAQEALKLGALDYIPKPFESQVLLKTIREALRK